MIRLQARASGPSLLAAVALAASAAVAAAPRPAGAQMGPGDMASAAGAEAPVAGGPVTRWSLAADRLGRGAANWRTQAIMHKAMHDALNAAEPRYARWAPAAEDEPPPEGAAPRVVMAAAAYQVLLARHPEQAPAEADRLFRHALREIVPIAASALLSAKLLRNGTLKVYEKFPHGMCTTHAETMSPDLLALIRS